MYVHACYKELNTWINTYLLKNNLPLCAMLNVRLTIEYVQKLTHHLIVKELSISHPEYCKHQLIDPL